MRVLETHSQPPAKAESLSPELRHLLHCTRPVIESMDEDVTDGVSWAKLMSIGAAHGLLPRLAERVAVNQNLCPDSTTRDTLETYLRANAARNLYLRRCAEDTTSTLAQAGIRALPLKGPFLAERLYGHPGLRECQDVDLLVPSSDIRTAIEVLVRAGYSKVSNFSAAQEQAVLRHNSEYQLRSPESILVELQWRLVPQYFCVELREQELWRAASSHLHPEAEFLALLLNGGKERWAKLITVLDLSQFFHRHPGANWSAVRRQATDLGLRRWLEMGSLLAQRLFGSEIPAALLTANADSIREALVAEYLRDLDNGSVLLDDRSLHNFHLRLREREVDRVRYSLRLAITPGRAEWDLIALPRWAAWLYYPIRVVRTAGKLVTERLSGVLSRRSET